MEQEMHITLRYNLSTGDVNLNEIVYKLKELRDQLMLVILKEILKKYGDLIAERLSRTDLYPSKGCISELGWCLFFPETGGLFKGSGIAFLRRGYQCPRRP